MDLRVLKTEELIRNTFLELLAQKEFTDISVKEITEKGRINRSTFYKHYEDKYLLRDSIIDQMMGEFREHIAVNFLVTDNLTSEKHIADLKRCLRYFHLEKKTYQLLGGSVMLGRNVFDEMVAEGADYMKKCILNHPDISSYRKKLADWYGYLLMNNLLVSVRWWFRNDDRVSLDDITGQILEHMRNGAIPTLLGKRTDEC